MCLLSYLCRSKEQRKNHREQLLSPLVKPRKQPLSTLPSHTDTQTHRQHTHTQTHTDTHIASRTLCSLPPLILSAVGLEYIAGSLVGAPTRFGWTLVQSEASVVPIPLHFAPRILLYQHMLPLILYFVCFNTETANRTLSRPLACWCRAGSESSLTYWKRSKDSSWTQYCYQERVGYYPSLLSHMDFPQGLFKWY